LQYRIVDQPKDGGTFWLNFLWSDIESLDRRLPAGLHRQLAQEHAKLCIINATEIAMKCGLRKEISTVVQASFFQFSGILGDNWIPIPERWIKTEYGQRGDHPDDQNGR
jgi:Pyruvate/2-oxoacid:ferredoxin oxidoreductase gamma subunit